MKTQGLLAIALAAGCVLTAPVQASDMTGLYTRIDKVVLEPSAEAPERIQVWGVFSIADPRDRNAYAPAARGYVYLKLDGTSAAAARNEWNDLKKMAGTGEIVSFGRRFDAPRLRKADEKPENPDRYAANIGVIRVSPRTDYAPIRAILDYRD